MKKNKKMLLYSIFTVFCIVLFVGGYHFFFSDVKGAYNPTEPYVVGQPLAMDIEVTTQDGMSVPAARPTPTPEATPISSGLPQATSSNLPQATSSTTPQATPTITITAPTSATISGDNNAGKVEFSNFSDYPSNFDIMNYSKLELKVIVYSNTTATTPIKNYNQVDNSASFQGKICLNDTKLGDTNTILNYGYGDGYISKFLTINDMENYYLNSSTGELTISYDLSALNSSQIADCITVQTGGTRKAIKIVSASFTEKEGLSSSDFIDLPPIPPAEGGEETKGQEDNPFVVLEVVTDKSLQTLTYLNTGSEPYNPVELTSEISVLTNEGKLNNNALTNAPFNFHFRNSFNVYDPSEKKMVSKKIGSFQPYYEIIATSMEDPAFDNVNPVAKADTKNWAKIKQSTQTNVKSGFLYLTTAGKGDMKITNYNGKAVSQDVQNNNDKYWIYYENKADIPAGATQFTPSDQNDINNNYLGKKSNVYFAISNWNVTTVTYKFTYYVLKNNDVFKHSIFKFETEKDYDDFNMQVIAITPQEINEMMKYDTMDTLDYIERADMIYISDLSANSDAQAQEAVDFYFKYVLGDKTTNTHPLHTLSGYEGNDLEWEACMKIIKRMSENENVPFLFNSAIVNNCKAYSTHVYKGKDNNGNLQCLSNDNKSTICNANKLFYIAAQFDLTLRREDDYAGTRTFMEDIYPYIKKIKLRENNGTAEYTGFYQRELCTHTNISKKEDVYFLWGEYTFFPTPNNVGNNDSTLQTKYGYKKDFKFNNNLANFIGSNGADGQNVVSLAVNQTLVGGGYYNTIMPVIEAILSGLFNKAAALKIQVKDSFKNGSNNLLYIDIDKDAKYNGNDVIKIPVTVQNTNNLDGKVTLTAIDPSTNSTKTLSATGDTGNEITIPASSTKEFVLEYPIDYWTSTTSYSQILIQGTATKTYQSATGPKVTSPVTTKFNLNLLERTLFNLY